MDRPLISRWTALALAFVMAVLLVVAVTSDLRAHDRIGREESAVTTAQRTLAADRSDLHTVAGLRDGQDGRLDALQGALRSLQSRVSTSQVDLMSTSETVSDQGIDIATLQTCLEGVNGALQAISSQDNGGAAGDISSVSDACLTLDGGDIEGMVYPFDFPDPFVLRVGGTYFAYATNSTEGNIQIIRSTDLTHWTAVGNALPKLPAWAQPGGTWAPAVLQIGSTFLLYYAAAVSGPGDGVECISVATATAPQGPFVDDSAGPLVCQSGLAGSIDPSPFVAADGTRYLQWKSNAGPATLWSEPLSASGTSFAPGSSPTKLLSADLSWEGGVIEAPDLVQAGGRYLLFYSGNQWDSAGYGVGVASCRGPLGPCDNLSSKPILSSGPDMAGPGGEDVFTDAAGHPWIAFHAWVPGAVGYPNSRALYMRRLDLTSAVPTVEAAG